MTTDQNEPAFPRFTTVTHNDSGRISSLHIDQPGMTMRDYFAGQALMGLLSSGGHDSTFFNIEVLMNNTWVIADAMLAERSKK